MAIFAAVQNWVLELTAPSGDPTRVVAGLPLALRLALDAQAAGMKGVLIRGDAAALHAVLSDVRLRLPIFEGEEDGFSVSSKHGFEDGAIASLVQAAIADEKPANLTVVRVPANWLVHRQLLRHLVEGKVSCPAVDGVIDLSRSPELRPDVPFSFSPINVVDAASARRAGRAAFVALRKPQDGWTARWLNRYISLPISRLLVKTPLTPNQVSVGILAIGLYGAYLASRGDYRSALLGAFLFQMQSILDGCDGEMSRVTYRGSLAGEWLDTVGDDVTNYSFFFGAGWGLYHTTGWLPYLVAGLVVVTCGVIASGLEYRYLIRIGSGDLLKYPLSAGEGASGLVAAIQPLFKRDTFVFLTFLAAVFSLLGPMLLIFAAGAVGVLFNVLKTEQRMAREKRAGLRAS
jgi:phosphatidylglycerophosphate synthase